MYRQLRLAALVLALSAGAPVVPGAAQPYRDPSVTMRVVGNLDLQRYAGLWYEIARFPNRFQRGCTGVTAEYGLRADGTISVRNTCRQGGLEGPVRSIDGSARVEGPGRLSVNFVSFLPFARGNYWVLDIDQAYRIAVVGEPSGRNGWILARTPRITPAQLERAKAALARNGYDVSQLEMVEQPR